MKHPLLFGLWVFCIGGLWAQNPATVTYTGQTTWANGSAYAGQFLHMYLFDANGTYLDTAMAVSDASGMYTISASAPWSSGCYAFLYTWDCNNNMLADTISYPNGTSIYQRDFVVCTATPPPPCQAGFTHRYAGSAIMVFTNTSSLPTSAGGTFVWDFGDGTTATTTGNGSGTINHTYSQSGTYNVCLFMTNHAGCTDSICQQVTVNIVQIPCIAQYSASPSTFNPLMIQFQNQGTALAPTYHWDFGDGNTSTSASPTHTYATPGTYRVCMAITSPTCSDTSCKQITVGTLQACPITAQANAYNNASFSFSVSPQRTGFSYVWDFGDGNTSTQSRPNHTYAQAGVYNACVVATDGQGCTDSSCVSVTVVSGQANINGYVIAFDSTLIDSTNGDIGLAYLIQYDTIGGGTLTAIDTVAFTQGSFQFTNVPPGQYRVKAALDPASMYYPYNIPTYSYNELFWNNAQTFQVAINNISVPVLMVPGNNPGGPGFIGGLVSQGANKRSQPLEEVSILLLDVNGEAVTHTQTDASGAYEFNNVAYGTYYLHPEWIGLPTERIKVELSAANPTSINQAFEVNSDGIVVVDIVSSVLTEEWTMLKVYPNPARASLFVEWEAAITEPVSIQVLDAMGREVAAIQTQTSQTKCELPVGDLVPGLYTLKFLSGSKMLQRTFVKQ